MNVFQIIIFLVLASIAQAANAAKSGKVKVSKSECVSRLSSDITKINGLPEKTSSIVTLQTLSSTYSYCAFYFQNKEIFYSYMHVADDIDIMATQLKLYYDGVAPLQYNEDKNKVIGSLEKLISLKL